MEQQRYEYDKDAHRDHHCCGCLNHTSNQRIDKGVKIEEQEPDVVKKSDSSIPLQSKNYPYPIVWIPPEYMKNNDEPRNFESEVENRRRFHATQSPMKIRSLLRGCQASGMAGFHST